MFVRHALQLSLSTLDLLFSLFLLITILQLMERPASPVVLTIAQVVQRIKYVVSVRVICNWWMALVWVVKSTIAWHAQARIFVGVAKQVTVFWVEIRVYLISVLSVLILARLAILIVVARLVFLHTVKSLWLKVLAASFVLILIAWVATTPVVVVALVVLQDIFFLLEDAPTLALQDVQSAQQLLHARLVSISTIYRTVHA